MEAAFSQTRSSATQRPPGRQIERFERHKARTIVSEVDVKCSRPVTGEMTMFEARYKELVLRMKARAEADGDIFLPNPEPSGPVDYALICMEPSLGRWAPTPDIATERINAGFRNFIYSLEDFILHFCANRYLCAGSERYFVTDVSKGAMLVVRAGKDRVERYNRWHSLLNEELDLLLRDSGHVIAVGNAVKKHFRDRGIRDFATIMHYSGQAASGRNAAIVGRVDEYEGYRGTVTLRDVIDNADEYMRSSAIPAGIRCEAIARLSAADLTDSRRKLMFIYKTAFEEICSRRAVRSER